jgi:DNA-directed RNA polymerase subunit RPC12/RpoP
MTKLIPAKCPSCGANLEFPEGMEMGHCMHCGAKVIIDKEVHVHGQTAIACPHCGGVGHFVCKGKVELVQQTTFSQNRISRVSCEGTGKCTFRVLDLDARICYSGKCHTCQGKGKGMFLNTCPTCRGTGKCPTCQGTGKCTYCKGIGKTKCEPCNGTGFKIYKG